MPRLFLSIVVLIILSAGPVLSANFRNGMNAYKRGDYATALKEWRPIAEEGHIKAQYNLGQMYVYGEGVTSNLRIAFEWFKDAAEQGFKCAQYNVGWMYDMGRGVSRNYKTAIYWYKLAADQDLSV